MEELQDRQTPLQPGNSNYLRHREARQGFTHEDWERETRETGLTDYLISSTCMQR